MGGPDPRRPVPEGQGGGAAVLHETHVSVHDEAGNAVSVTHTLGTGSGVVTPGLGFVWNNSMKLADPVPGRANSLAPGKARTTGMVPTMLLRDGKPFLIVGAPGGSVIISSVLQTILNVVDFGMSPVEAVSAPRIHCEGGPSSPRRASKAGWCGSWRRWATRSGTARSATTPTSPGRTPSSSRAGVGAAAPIRAAAAAWRAPEGRRTGSSGGRIFAVAGPRTGESN